MHISFFYLIQGIIVGMAISVSVGPVALVTMKRTAEFGLRAGIISAITVAFIDTIVAVFILLGIHSSLSPFTHIPREIHFLGILIIFVYGIYLFTKKIKPEKILEQPLKKHFWETIFFSFANPSTYLSFGVIALLLTRFLRVSLFDRIELIVGFFAGAVFWWLSLVYITFKNRNKISTEHLQKGVGVLIMILALTALFMPGRFEHFSLIRIFS